MKTTFTFLKAMSFCLLALSFAPQLHADEDDALWALICPDDVIASCTDELWDLSIYGNAQYHDYHGYHDAGAPSESYHMSSCNTGYIYRTWSIEDPNWNWVSCTQTITVTSGSYGSFGYNNIQWPSNTTVEGCSPDTDKSITGEPTWDNVQCSMIGVSHKDKLFTFNGSCSKIVREWTVMDWCQRVGTYGPYKTWTYKQIIKIINNDPPSFTCIDDVTVSSSNCKNAYVEFDDFTVDDTACDMPVSISNDSPYADHGGANISGTYPVGKTKVTLSIRYGCGRTKACDVLVTVVNDGGPVPLCIGELSIALMGMDTDEDGINDEGMAEIWAKDLDWKSYDPCYNSDHLRFSFSEDVDSMARTFTCAEVGENVVKMYVTDYAGNQNYCEVIIDVQNNGANIQDCTRPDSTTVVPSTIAGKVVHHRADQENLGVEGIEVNLVGMEDRTEIVAITDTLIVITRDSFINGAGYWLYTEKHDSSFVTTYDTVTVDPISYTAMTDESGGYTFEPKAMDQTYKLQCISDIKLEPSKIEAADVKRVFSYILDGKKFESAREYVAADIDRDGKIDVNDVKALMKIYYNGYDTPQQAWRLVYDIESVELSPKAVAKAEDWLMVDTSMIEKPLAGFALVQVGDLVPSQEDKSAGSDVVLRSEVEQVFDGPVVTPNPFSSTINIDYYSWSEGEIDIDIQDVTGRRISLSKASVQKGQNTLSVDLSKAPNGVLIYKIKRGLISHTGRLIKI